MRFLDVLATAFAQLRANKLRSFFTLLGVIVSVTFLVAVVAIAALSHRGAPRTSWTGGVLGVLGGFGHAVFGGLALSYLALAADAGHRDVLGDVVTRIEAGPAQLFMAMGLVGTVLGLVLLGVALFRSRVVPRWIPVALWAFVVLEFGLGGVALRVIERPNFFWPAVIGSGIADVGYEKCKGELLMRQSKRYPDAHRDLGRSDTFLDVKAPRFRYG